MIMSRILLTLALALSLGLATAVADETSGERFQGTIFDPGGNLPGRSTAPVIFQVDSYSSDAEVAALAKVLAEQGPEALREAMWDLEKGWIRVAGSVGYPIAVARSIPGPNGRTVRLMIDRPIDFFEAVRNLRTTDYPFSMVEVQLDAEGKGEGQLIAAAAVSLTGNTVQVESYGPQPFRLMNVRARPR